jgi:uncharacterized protein
MNKEQVKQKIVEAIHVDPNKNAIQKVSLFGSYAYGSPENNSDIDVLIEFKPGSKISFFKFFDTRENFEKHVGKKIDLLTPEALSEFFRDKVLAKAETIYER